MGNDSIVIVHSRLYVSALSIALVRIGTLTHRARNLLLLCTSDPPMVQDRKPLAGLRDHGQLLVDLVTRLLGAGRAVAA
eukprot:6469097-Pyramimonas_sp.AAC.1